MVHREPNQQPAISPCSDSRSGDRGAATGASQVRDDSALNAHHTNRSHRARVVAAVLVLATFMGVIASMGAAALVPAADAGVVTDGVRYSIVRDGLRYDFQAVLGAESLVDLSEPQPRQNRIGVRAADAARLRAALAASQGVDSVEALRERHRALIEGLRKFGYL